MHNLQGPLSLFLHKGHTLFLSSALWITCDNCYLNKMDQMERQSRPFFSFMEKPKLLPLPSSWLVPKALLIPSSLTGQQGRSSCTVASQGLCSHLQQPQELRDISVASLAKYIHQEVLGSTPTSCQPQHHPTCSHNMGTILKQLSYQKCIFRESTMDSTCTFRGL